MSISSLTGLSPTPTNTSGTGHRRQDFQNLSQALKAGDLTGAQQAFAKLTQDLSGQSGAPTSIVAQLKDPNSPLGKDLAAIGQALQSGDISGAQQDFLKLRQDIKAQVQTQGQTGATHGHHHHHQPDNDADDGAGSAVQASSTTNTSTSGNAVNITA